MLPLETDGKLLVFHVGTNVVHLDGVAHEVGPGPTDVEGGFVELFLHESMMAHPGSSRSSRGYKTGNSSITRAYGSAATDIPFDTDSYQQKYNATKP